MFEQLTRVGFQTN